jgi:sialate O-acetylesterase
LHENYGIKSVGVKSPTYKSFTIENNKITISFNNIGSGLFIKGENATCFEIAGLDKKFLSAQAILEGDKIIVFNNNIKKPTAVRFAFSNTAIPNLFNKEGLPVNLFRTDNWEIDTAPLKQ